jgi:SNF2 family DNA or RNA helicase
MILLHAGYVEDSLLLWGESPVEGVVRSKGKRGRKPKEPRREPYLFNAGSEGLISALKSAGLPDKVDEERMETAIAWLPTKGRAPIPSSPLIAEPPASSAQPILAPWIITVLPLHTDEAIELLCASVGRQTIAPGVVVGHDLAFWGQALRFSGALAARQHFLPGLVVNDGVYRARWEPSFVAQDAEKLTDLAQEMPAVATALSRGAVLRPPERPSISVLIDFISEIVDHLVRSTASEQSHPARRRRKGRPKPQTFDSLHDQWLYALKAPDGVMIGDEDELAELAMQVREWRRPITISMESPYRLCFRLEEPEDEKEKEEKRSKPVRNSWYVRYFLQALDDPSLLIPVKDVWNPRGRKAALLKRGGFNAKMYVLSALGQAAGLCPRIERSLETSAPAGYELNAAGAHEFLTERAVALEQSGFGVMLPAWWTRKGTKVRLSVRAQVKSPKMQGGSGLSLAEMVRFHWEIAVGGEKLSFEELETLAKLKQPLVKVRGQWVEMNAEEIQAALDFWKNKSRGSASVREILQMALGGSETVGGLAFDGVRASGWIGQLLKQLEGGITFEELPHPEDFHGTLRPYQVRGYSWLAFLHQWGLGACLADDMGLGKTIQTLALILRDWQGDGDRPVLLVCPTSVATNWKKEAERFTPGLPVMIHHGVERKRNKEFKDEVERHALVITTYALLHRDMQHLQEVDWAGVVLDEAQNIKNPETKQAKAARSIPADYRIALTGTPVENNVGDLWSIMEFLNPGFLGTQASFKRDFFIPIQAGRDQEVIGRLKRLTGPFILRRLKTDTSIISDLPEKMEMKVFCSLSKEQASLYAAVLRELERSLKSSEGIKRKGVILGTLSKLKQVCNHPAQFLGDNSSIPGRSGKVERLAEMLEEIIEVGDRALVFSQFSEMGEILRQYLQETFGREILFLHGGVPKRHRDVMIERFQASGDGPPIFILSLKAGGTGLNLTRANHVFHFDRWWNPAVENQATDRAYRIGQTQNVQVHKFICAGTLEDKIDEMIERKKKVAKDVIGTGEAWLTELSNSQIREIFALRKEAIGA